MSIQPSAIRQRLATSLNALTGWYEALVPHAAFPLGETRPKAHKVFSVEVLGTSFLSARKQRLSEPQYVNTEIEVKVALRLRPQSQRSDIDTATDATQTVLQNLLSASKSDVSLEVQSIDYQVLPGNDWFVGTLRFNAHHMYAIS